jgi:hypothetical protein
LWKIINAIAFDHIRDIDKLNHYSAENFVLRGIRYDENDTELIVISSGSFIRRSNLDELKTSYILKPDFIPNSKMGTSLF